MARVGVVVTDTYWVPAGDQDTGPLIAALERLGIAAEPVVWHQWQAQDAERFDLLVIRSPWDYTEREAEFRAWLQTTGAQLPVLNSPELIEWNLDKVYLQQLQHKGISIVPTTWVQDAAELEQALASYGQQWTVLKPSVSAGSLNTELLRADSAEAFALGARIINSGRTLLIQPEVPELTAGDERALYFIGGEHTHTIAKGALLERGGGLLGGNYQERPQLVSASEEEQAFGAAVLSAVQEVTGTGMPLYGRIDIVTTAQWGTVLLEAELFEPALNLQRAPEAADVLAAAIAARLPVQAQA
ncbi:hypothetical protein [Nesterenkonia rhizosphaerae]|uniref:ATP-grasp domain-containing protein n=1 Tax=Nesterenkonia rhizosphaerae TaxID=1348272 RepID=A0ABP9G1N8_9MICC